MLFRAGRGRRSQDRLRCGAGADIPEIARRIAPRLPVVEVRAQGAYVRRRCHSPSAPKVRSKALTPCTAAPSILARTAPARPASNRASACQTTTLRLEKSPTGESTGRSEEHTSELQSRGHLVCRL